MAHFIFERLLNIIEIVCNILLSAIVKLKERDDKELKEIDNKE